MIPAESRDRHIISLTNTITRLKDIDDFIAKLWDIHLEVKKEGYAQNLTLGLFRSDYMVHLDPTQSNPKPTIRQVEFNTIASSFGGLSSRVSSLHKYLLQTAAYPREAAAVIRPDFLPSNSSIESLASGLAKAHEAYNAYRNPSQPPRLRCIIFLVQENERNVFDQKHIEYALFAQARVKVFRLPFSQVLSSTSITPDASRALLYTPPAFPDRTYEVSTIYFRAGYSPDEYTTDDAWKARLHLERSAAIKCPSILTHLAGCKKVQQILATPESPHLARFLPYPSLAARVQRTFAPMYPMDGTSAAGQEGRRLALDPESAKRFVLKPQREGGGNNIYRTKIPEFLKSIPEEKWAAYVLMEMIETPAQRNAVLRNGEIMEGGVICELGVYGTCLWSHGPMVREEGEQVPPGGEESRGILLNEEAGTLLRTKGDQSEEGGVAAGFGAVDSVCLIDL